MAYLIALLSSGKGTWAQVNSIMKSTEWEKIYLVCNDFAYTNFEVDPTIATKLKFDEKYPNKAFPILAKFFKKEIKGFEVALNLSSGTGAEHMMVTSAVLKAGLGLRFVYFDMNELKEFEILEGSYTTDEDDDLVF